MASPQAVGSRALSLWRLRALPSRPETGHRVSAAEVRLLERLGERRHRSRPRPRPTRMVPYQRWF